MRNVDQPTACSGTSILDHLFTSAPLEPTVQLSLATTAASSWHVATDDLWRRLPAKMSSKSPLITFADSGNYPLQLTDDQLKQLHSVYDTCISKQHYLPQLINSENHDEVFSSGLLVSETLFNPNCLLSAGKGKHQPQFLGRYFAGIMFMFCCKFFQKRY